MNEPVVPPATPVPASQRYRARADECRLKARSFRDPKARAQMLNLAADYSSFGRERILACPLYSRKRTKKADIGDQ